MHYYFPLANLYFTAIPKSGCTSALNFLWAVEEGLGASPIAPVNPERLRYFADPKAGHQACLANYAVDSESGVPSDALRVIVLRNSMDRVASCWKDKVLLGQESNIVLTFGTEPWFPQLGDMHSSDDLARMFVEFLDSLEQYPVVFSANDHWNSQLNQAHPLETYDIVLSTKLLGTLPYVLAQRGGRLSHLGRAKMPKFHETGFIDARLFMSNDATRLASVIYSTDDEAMMRFGVAYESRVIRSWKQEPTLAPETTRLVIPAIRRIAEIYREHWLSLQYLETVKGQ